jgi:glucan 1,3-beta-glucosidase
MISAPIVRYYCTVFVGDPNNHPRVMGTANFNGIALIDTDVYIAGGNNWYINTNDFYCRIRNIILDLMLMPNYIPTEAKV